MTYNHEHFIEQCLNGFVSQKTNFVFEVLVHDDASTDRTAQIVEKFEKKYPQIFKVIYQKENVFSRSANNLVDVLFRLSKGKYIALCEGDDYWTDPLKLQKQVDFLEKNPDYSLCFHNVIMQYDNGVQKLSKNSHKTSFDIVDLIRDGRPCHTCSVLFRNSKDLSRSMLGYRPFLSGDIALMLNLSLQGKFGRVEGVMGVYRIHSQGLTKSQQFVNNWKDSYVALLEYFDHLTRKKFHSDVIFKITEIRQSQIQSAGTFGRLIIFASKLAKKSLKGFAGSLGLILLSLLKLIYNRLQLFWVKKKLFFLKKQAKNLYLSILAWWKTSSEGLNDSSMLHAVVASPYTGLAMDQKLKIFPASAFSNHKIPVLYAATPNNSVLSGFFDFATVIQHGPWNNYYHWYIDIVPRIWGLHREDYKKIESIELLLTKKLSKEEEGLLEALLPDNVRLEIVPKESLFQVRNFIFLPFLSQNCYGKLPAEYLNFFLVRAENYFSLKKGPGIKLFITRKLAQKRKFLNEEEIVHWMAANGFEVVALEGLSIGDQAQLFYNAEIIVAQHGAGLTNLLYCRDAHVIEIFSAPNTHLNHYRGLCEAKQLGYTPIYMNGKHKNDDAYCDILLIEQALNAVYADKID